MLEFQLVDYPQIFPQACIACRSATGPQLDTHVEIEGFGWVYLCQLCAKRAAVAFGFSDGERMDELSVASDELVAKEREIAQLFRQLGDSALKVAALVNARDAK